MKLSQERFLFLDCQTTGIRPPAGRLLEVAWGIGSAEAGELEWQKSELIQLPDSTIPRQIQKITGLKDADLQSAIADEIIFKTLGAIVKDEKVKTAIIHYSQLEQAFFEDLFLRYQNDKTLPFQILCTARISKGLFPALPSGNIRAVAGYFGASTEEFKRAAAHVTATYHIWKSVAHHLDQLGLECTQDVNAWLSKKKVGPSAKIPYEYRIEKLTRLAIPETPGIYRMRNKQDEVLYVGKAKSLRSRVNSYFRGKKGRDRKKLEMLSQVWNIDYVECPTPLEAALLETDEIKRLNPPYNIYLKDDRRNCIFYDHQFLSASENANTLHLIGPFRPNGTMEQLRLMCKGLLTEKIEQVFYVEIPEGILNAGFLEFCNEVGIDTATICWVRNALAVGLQLLRRQKRLSKIVDTINEIDLGKDTQVSVELEFDLTAADVSAKIRRLFLRAAKVYVRARKMTRLLNSKIEWTENKTFYSLKVINGKINPIENSVTQKKLMPWSDLNLSDYDRMSILLSEIERHDHKVTVVVASNLSGTHATF